MLRDWTDAERQFVFDNCHALKDLELAATLTRLRGSTVTSRDVESLRVSLGISKKRGQGKGGIISKPDQYYPL